MNALVQFPREFTRYGNAITYWPAMDATDEIRSFLTQICLDQKGQVHIATVESAGRLDFRTLSVDAAQDFIRHHCVDRNVVAYLPPALGVSIRLKYEADSVPYGLARKEALWLLEELALSPSYVVDSGDEINAVFLYREYAPDAAAGDVVQNRVEQGFARLAQASLAKKVSFSEDNNRLMHVPGTFNHHGQLQRVECILSPGTRFTPSHLLRYLFETEEK